MANHMAEVAKMLGVELGEEFEVSRYPSVDCTIKEGGLYIRGKDIQDNFLTYGDIILINLLRGECTIKRKPWKPERGETYWYVEKDGDIWEREWHPCMYMSDHANRYKLGNCYRTRGEAEANRDKWVAFYTSDEVLEV